MLVDHACELQSEIERQPHKTYLSVFCMFLGFLVKKEASCKGRKEGSHSFQSVLYR